MKTGRFQHDDFITDSIYSADGHIGFERLRLIDYSVQLTREPVGFYMLATCLFKRLERRSELNIVEKFVDEAQKVFQNLEMTRKVFQFNDLILYINLYFSIQETGAFAPIRMQRMLKNQVAKNVCRTLISRA